MKTSELIALLQAELETNGDAEHVALGFIVNKGGAFHRVDVYGEIEVLNDPNYPKGMVYLVGGEIGQDAMKTLSQ